MKRRQFVKLTSTASAIGLMPFQLQASLKLANSVFNCDFTNRKLVLIELAGGNDGLNTVIPINVFTNYQDLRPNIYIPPSQYLPLNTIDSSIQGTNQDIALHPALSGFQTLYGQDQMRIIQSVGYPYQNKSHFASKDIYATGNDGSGWANGNSSGWIGRFMEQHYNQFIPTTFPLGVQIGSPSLNLGFHGVVEHGLAININGQDAENFYSVLSGLAGDAPTNIPNSHYGTELQYIIDTDALSNQYSETISNAFNSGTNLATYPNSNLANQLKTVARLIRGNMQSKVYLVSLGGFDTHNAQNQSSGDILGTHNDLLNQLSEAVSSFMQDINADSIGEDIVGLTFSEFGRKAKENGSLGTDHGEVAPMFVFGRPVRSGISGINVDLTEATTDNNFQIESVQYDYRSTFTTLFQDFLGASDSQIDATFLDNSTNSSFTDSKINELLKDNYKVEATCYDQTLNQTEPTVGEWAVFPNPFQDHIDITSEYPELETHFELRNQLGQLLKNGVLTFSNSMARISTENLADGIYFLTLKNDHDTSVNKLIKH
jgi:uncharacterized protein (DUF1501 family)